MPAAIGQGVCYCGTKAPARTIQIARDFECGAEHRLVKCPECGLVRIDPMPEPSTIMELSPGYQRRMQWMFDDLRDSRVGRLGLRMMRATRKPTGTPGDVLDVGCAYGQYLQFLLNLGWRVTGIELDPEAAKSAGESLQAPVLAGPAETRLADLPDASFDLVTMWHVLEHLTNPLAALVQIRRVLRPGGRLVLEVPNFGSLWSRVFGRFWFPLELPFHLFHFSAASIRELLTAAGFESVKITGEPAPAELTWCLDVLSCHVRGKPWSGRLLWSPALVVLLYPLEFLLALCGLSNHMKVVAGVPR
jgi:SAM-dependent methyltransferase